MINPHSLLAMQYGGTAGGATLARALQQRSDADTLEEYQKAEAERQKRGRLFGSVGGLGLGLLGAALAPATGGLSLALASGAGTALGKGIGERVGAGKAEGYDRSGTVYGQRAFKDVAEASKEYNRGIAGRAGMAGLQAGLTAGLAPGGGMYGKVGGKLGTAQARTAFLEGLPLRAESLSTGISNMFTGAPTPSMPVAPSVNRLPSDMVIPFNPNANIFDPSTVFQQSSYDPFSVLSGPRLPGGSYTSMSGVQDGGLIGMQYGGYGGNVEDILEEAGLNPTSEQLALFEQFDPTQLQDVAEGLQQSLLSGTQGAQQHQAKAGFGGMGATQYGQTQQRKKAGETYESEQQRAYKAFESKTLGQAAEQIAGGAEFGTVIHTNAPNNPNIGDTYMREGTEYEWTGSAWSEVVDYDDWGSEYDHDYYSSDIILKENINLVGQSDSGVNIYTFEYKDSQHGEGVYTGVIAQEVPWASTMMDNGYLAVDYNKVDVDFERIA